VNKKQIKLREIAEDYLHLAADEDGNTDVTRRKNYAWLMKLADRLQTKRPRKGQ
jgi:hypothetical protein